MLCIPNGSAVTLRPWKRGVAYGYSPSKRNVVAFHCVNHRMAAHAKIAAPQSTNLFAAILQHSIGLTVGRLASLFFTFTLAYPLRLVKAPAFSIYYIIICVERVRTQSACSDSFLMIVILPAFDERKTIVCGRRRCKRSSCGLWAPRRQRFCRTACRKRYAAQPGTPCVPNASSTAARSGASKTLPVCRRGSSQRREFRSADSGRSAPSSRRLAEIEELRPDGGRRSGGRRRCNRSASTGPP